MISAFSSADLLTMEMLIFNTVFRSAQFVKAPESMSAVNWWRQEFTLTCTQVVRKFDKSELQKVQYPLSGQGEETDIFISADCRFPRSVKRDEGKLMLCAQNLHNKDIDDWANLADALPVSKVFEASQLKVMLHQETSGLSIAIEFVV